MKYNDPREALQDLINTDSNLKEELITACQELNPGQALCTDYVLIQETTFKKVTRVLHQAFHPDKLSQNNISPDIAHEIAQIINSARYAIEKQSKITEEYKETITYEYYNFLIALNPYAFIKAITGKPERKDNYDWYDDKNSYEFYLDYIDFLNSNDEDLKKQKAKSSILNVIQKMDKLKLEETFISLFSINAQNKEEINTLKEKLQRLQDLKTLLEIKLEQISNKSTFIKDEGIRLENEAKRLNDLQANTEKEIDEIYINLSETATKQEEKEQTLNTRESELEQKEAELINRENNLKKQIEELKILEIIVNREKTRNEKLANDTVESMLELTSFYENKLSPEKLFSDENLELVRNALVHVKNNYYEKLLSEIKREQIIFGDIDYIDFKGIKSWYKIFNNSENIFRNLENIFINLNKDFSLDKLSSKSPEIRKLTKKLNDLEKKEFFKSFLDSIINKITRDEKIRLITSLSKIIDNTVYEGSYRNLVLEAINDYIRNLRYLENIINNEIFGKNYVKFDKEFKEFKEILKMGELSYLHKYKSHYSQLNDEKGGLSLAFDIDGRNPVEDVIFDIEKKLEKLKRI